jgi:hypothetical protein
MFNVCSEKFKVIVSARFNNVGDKLRDTEMGDVVIIDIMDNILSWSEANFGESKIFVIEGIMGLINLINWIF